MNERKRTEDKLNDKTFYNVSKKKIESATKKKRSTLIKHCKLSNFVV